MTGDILEQYIETRSPELRNRLVESNLYIAGIVARKFSGRGVEYDDLYQVASFALMKAIERYDPGQGARLTSYVVPSMIGEVKNYFRDRSRTIRLPRRSGEALKAVDAARERLQKRLMREPTYDELAREAGMEMDALIELLETRGAISPTSIDDVRDGEASLAETLGAPEAGYAQFEAREVVKSLMDTLPDMERQVIQLRYFEGKSQRDTAASMSVSQMTVSRAERRALSLLREALSRE